ncbi:MAG: Rossmann-like and DUF2520 domain-containing protein [Actinomycetota bacterium]
MARRPTVSIVGCGRVGGAIGLALRAAGYEITAVWSQSRAGRQRAHRLLDAPVLEPAAVAAAGDVVFLSVSDDAIADMAKQIAPGVRKGKYVVHTSGGVSVSTLQPALRAGAHVGSIHPLQTIPDAVTGAEALRGAAVAVTCEPKDRQALHRIARAWGGQPFVLSDEDKSIYHAAAIFASNYVVSTLWAATELLRSIGIRTPAPLLEPLVRTSVDNFFATGPAKAITGPVVRGDTGVVRRHIADLKKADHPTGDRIRSTYRSLARLTAALAGTDPDVIEKATA